LTPVVVLLQFVVLLTMRLPLRLIPSLLPTLLPTQAPSTGQGSSDIVPLSARQKPGRIWSDSNMLPFSLQLMLSGQGKQASSEAAR
jgi:hypothetical protein